MPNALCQQFAQILNGKIMDFKDRLCAVIRPRVARAFQTLS